MTERTYRHERYGREGWFDDRDREERGYPNSRERRMGPSYDRDDYGEPDRLRGHGGRSGREVGYRGSGREGRAGGEPWGSYDWGGGYGREAAYSSYDWGGGIEGGPDRSEWPWWRRPDNSGGTVGERGYGSGRESRSGGRTGGFGGRELGRGRFTGRGPRGYQRSDDRVREDVCECLTQHPEIDAREIDLTVTNGEVTLSGSVDSRWAKRLAEDVVEGLPGVKDVHNRLRVAPSTDATETAPIGRMVPFSDTLAAGGSTTGATRGPRTR